MPGPDIITMGCRLNIAESEAIRQMAADQDDLIVVNSCAVTAEAVRQTRQAIRRARRERPDARILVTGCAAQTEPQTFAAMAEVDAVIGNREKMEAATYHRPFGSSEVEKRLAHPDRFSTVFEANGGLDLPKVRVADIMAVRDTAPHMASAFADHARAFLEVQNGCDHRCTFCIIPYGRGNSRSVPAGEVVDQVKRLVQSGHKEVVLTGVDLTSWGNDLPGHPPLGNLVARILKLVPDLPLLRLSSIDAIEMDTALFELATTETRFAPYLHVSLQHGDTMILKRMKRRHSREDAIELTSKLKAARPEIAFGADLIAGFPTETEEMFENSVSLIEACQLSFVHVFPYSPRKGTPAAKIPQLDRRLIKDRAARLREAGSAALERHLASHVGHKRRVLLEAGGHGRLADFTQVTDLPANLPHGEFADLRVTGQRDGRLTGELA